MFVTGVDVLCVPIIHVQFTVLDGIARRPIAHTCGSVLELPSTYDEYAEFRPEFSNVLAKGKWQNDIMVSRETSMKNRRKGGSSVNRGRGFRQEYLATLIGEESVAPTGGDSVFSRCSDESTLNHYQPADENDQRSSDAGGNDQDTVHDSGSMQTPAGTSSGSDEGSECGSGSGPDFGCDNGKDPPSPDYRRIDSVVTNATEMYKPLFLLSFSVSEMTCKQNLSNAMQIINPAPYYKSLAHVPSTLSLFLTCNHTKFLLLNCSTTAFLS